MPRRAAALATPSTSTPLTDPIHNPQQDDPFAAEVSLLRRQWKWAAFSQFFYTFATLFSTPDVSLTDIEDDLTRSTSIVIHRVMHRLLVTATQDRKLLPENWQTALRKQYKKRDPNLNPIGPEPVVQLPTPEPDTPAGPDDDQVKAESSTPGPSSDRALGNPHQADTEMDDDQLGESSAEPKFAEMKAESMSIEGTSLNELEEESKDWLSLPMLTKLDSLHLLTEWQFHNVNRLRTIMRDDDETAQWRIEPVGYDAKANAYWLIGPDRLWVQRAIPKPPRSLKRKRVPTKPKPKRATALPDDEPDTPPAPKKRKAAAARSRAISTPAVTPKAPTRSARTRRPPSSPEELGPITSRGPRAAKMQASVKLSAQAKELAELQRQAALENRRSGRRVVSPSPPRTVSPLRPLGTRMSARLRGVAQVDDEWQEIPDDWLKDRDDGEEDGGASGSERLDGEAEVGQSNDPRPEPEPEPRPDPDTDTQRTKMILESDDDAVSELTELTEISPPATVLASPSKTRRASKKSSSSRRKPSRSKHRQVDESELMEQPLEEVEPEEEIEPEWRLPDDFVEWETICVTLSEWEHICERFESATHYAEKALYKLLSQHIVPAIVAELREIQQKRQLEEAISQRKRSSRLAIKENEKEEARLASLRKAEEEEKMSRVRRLEARQKREEEERLKREVAREKRRLDREERDRKAQAREEEEEERTNASSSVDIAGVDPTPQHKPPAKPPKGKPGRPRTKAAPPTASSSATTSGARTPAGEDWILDCEVCHRSGVNKDDGSPLLCCGKCSKWQHIACHDSADRQAGRPKRNWDTEEFICRACQGRVVANGRQVVPNGSSYDTGRTPSPYYHQSPGYAGQAPYGQNYSPSHHARPPYPQHAAITFSHYQPQHRGFSTANTAYSPPHHAQPMSQSHYTAHGSSPSKLASQCSTPQYPHNIFSNGTAWPAPSSSSSPAHSGTSWSAHAPGAQTTTGYPPVLSSPSYGSSAERTSMSGAGAAYANSVPAAAATQNGNSATAAASTATTMASTTTAAMQQPQPWRGNPYVAPVGGGGGGHGSGSGGVAYYSSSSPSQASPQHRAP